MEPYWGGAYYHPAYWGGYPCCGSASANVYGHWGNATYSGTRSWYAGGGVAAEHVQRQLRDRARNDGQHQRRSPIQRMDGQRDARLRPHGQHGGRRLRQRRAGRQLQHVHGPALDGIERVGHRRGWQQLPAHRRDDGGARRLRARRRGSTYNAKTGKTNTWGTASVGNNHYADVNGNVYHNDGSGWQQHSSSGWSGASGDSSWADKESQARSSGRRQVRRLLQQRSGSLRRRRLRRRR
jgi:hypothetical protein